MFRKKKGRSVLLSQENFEEHYLSELPLRLLYRRYIMEIVIMTVLN